MKIGVIGFGSIGQRHARNLRDLGVSVAIFDPLERQVKKAEEEKFETFTNLEKLLSSKIDGVLICSPNSMHVEHALLALRYTRNIFIEKPIADKVESNLNILKKTALQKKANVLIGCNLRFMKAFQEMKKIIDSKEFGKVLSVNAAFGYYLPFWRPNVDYRKNYSASAKMGGGIILDAIHEIDYCNWLFGKFKTVNCTAGKISNLEIDVEDNAEITAITENNTVVQMHLDYLSRNYTRNCKITCSEGTIYWDWNDCKVQVFSSSGQLSITIDCREDNDKNKMYVEEMKHFLNCINGVETPTLTLEFAIHDLKSALCAKKSAKIKKTKVRLFSEQKHTLITNVEGIGLY